MDETSAFCSYCYSIVEKKLRCGKCKKRIFCSRECQKLDWKKAGHNHFCGVSCEIGFDFEIKKAPNNNKGLGVFALRRLEKDEKIMVERPILVFHDHDLRNVSMQQIDQQSHGSIQKLVPEDGTLIDKIKRNGMACTADDDLSNVHKTGLFITMSRVNHDCMGNSSHYYLEHRNVKILVAARAIEKGEEVSFSYCSSDPFSRKRNMQIHYGFTCDCKVCKTPAIEEDLCRMKKLDETILQRGQNGNIPGAIQAGKTLLKLYEKYQRSSFLYHRTYYDLYQMAIMKKRTADEGTKYIKKAYQSILAFTSDEEENSVKMVAAYSENPTSHRNYLLLDNFGN